MNIIIEGPEASGKTTLAQTILDKYPYFEYSHATSKASNDYNYYKELLNKNYSLYDSFCIRELVYHKIYNIGPAINIEEVYNLFNQCKENNNIFIILYSSNIDILKNRLKERSGFNYLNDIELQNRWFLACAWNLSTNDYDRYFVVDIAKMKQINDLYNSLNKILSNKENKYDNK